MIAVYLFLQRSCKNNQELKSYVQLDRVQINYQMTEPEVPWRALPSTNQWSLDCGLRTTALPSPRMSYWEGRLKQCNGEEQRL